MDAMIDLQLLRVDGRLVALLMAFLLLAFLLLAFLLWLEGWGSVPLLTLLVRYVLFVAGIVVVGIVVVGILAVGFGGGLGRRRQRAGLLFLG
jgi:hypothetical protein